MLELDDLDFIKNAIEEVGEYTDEFITIYTVSSSTGTLASLEPRTITYISKEMKAKVRRISAREINESGGIYKQDDLTINSTGSFSSDVRIAYRSGTYEVIDNQAPLFIGADDVLWRTVLRRA